MAECCCPPRPDDPAEQRSCPKSGTPGHAVDLSTVKVLLTDKGVISPLVFPQLRGRKYLGKRIASFRKAWDAARKAVGCPGRIFHDFRRTAVRNLTRTGMIDPTVSMKVMRHKTRSVFARYNIGNENVRRALATVLGTVGQFHRPSADRKSRKAQ